MEEKKRWSKLSIIASICLIFPFFFLLLNFLLGNSILNIISYFLFLFFLASLILAIISLVQIKKYNLKGKWLAILTIIIWGLSVLIIIILIGFFINALANCGTEYYYKAPLKINIKGTNYQIRQIDNTSKDPNIFLINFNLSLDNALNKCALDGFRFNLHSPEVIFADAEGKDYVSRGFYDASWISSVKGNYSGSEFMDYVLHLKESQTIFKQNIENLLRLNKEEFSLEYYIKPFYSQKAPEAGNVGVGGQEAYGCYIIDRRIMGEDTNMLKVTGTEGKLNLNPKRILCVKPYNGKTDISNKNCIFYELTSSLEISYNIDLSKGEEEVYRHSCF